MMPFAAAPNGSAANESSAIQSNPASKSNPLSVGGGGANPLPKTGLGLSKVWGNASQIGRAMGSATAPSDFPTAAEASSSEFLS